MVKQNEKEKFYVIICLCIICIACIHDSYHHNKFEKTLYMTPKLLYLHCALVAFVMFSCNNSGTTDNNTLYHR